MSGTQPTFPYPMQLGRAPKEGPKYLSLIVNLSTVPALPLTVNLLSQNQSGQFSSIQSVIVDNTSSGVSVSVRSLESGVIVRVPPFTLGCYPLICGPAPEFEINVLDNGQFYSGTTGFFFLNISDTLFETRYLGQAQSYAVASQSINAGTPFQLPLLNTSAQRCLISAIDLSLTPFSAPAAAVTGLVQIYEQGNGGQPNTGPNYAPIWATPFAIAAGQTTVFLSRQVSFPNPILQRYDGNPVWLVANGGGMPGLLASINVSYIFRTIA